MTINLEIKNINEENFKILFSKYYKSLVYFAYRYVMSEQAAEDIVHDVFVSIWNKRQKLNYDKNMKAYLYTAVRNKALLYLDKRKVRIKYLEKVRLVELDLITPERIVVKQEMENAISNAINELPDKRKEIFLMHRYDKLTYFEISKTLNISVKTVETQMSRALNVLRKKLAFLLK